MGKVIARNIPTITKVVYDQPSLSDEKRKRIQNIIAQMIIHSIKNEQG